MKTLLFPLGLFLLGSACTAQAPTLRIDDFSLADIEQTVFCSFHRKDAVKGSVIFTSEFGASDTGYTVKLDGELRNLLATQTGWTDRIADWRFTQNGYTVVINMVDQSEDEEIKEIVGQMTVTHEKSSETIDILGSCSA